MSDQEKQQMYELYDQYRSCFDRAREQNNESDLLGEILAEEVMEIVQQSSDIPEEDEAEFWDAAWRDLTSRAFMAGMIYASDQKPDEYDALTVVLDSDSVSGVVKGLVDGRLSIHLIVERP
jgi:hypothetical protein